MTVKAPTTERGSRLQESEGPKSVRGSFIRNLGFIVETSHPEILHRGTYYSLAFFFLPISFGLLQRGVHIFPLSQCTCYGKSHNSFIFLKERWKVSETTVGSLPTSTGLWKELSDKVVSGTQNESSGLIKWVMTKFYSRKAQTEPSQRENFSVRYSCLTPITVSPKHIHAFGLTLR